MRIKLLYGALLLCITAGMVSCSPKNISSQYYLENQKTLEKIEESYKELYKQKPFNILFADKSFNIFSLEIITDSLLYIYEFKMHEPRLKDTLAKYDLNVTKTENLIDKMQSIRCNWVNNLDYYENEKKYSLILMSIKPVALSGFFSSKKYYILSYFPQPQHYDKRGRPFTNRKSRKFQRINGEIFTRINDKVSYTISGQFR